LGGKPINLKDMADGVDEDTISRNLTKLETEGYIIKIRTPYGIGIRVNKAQKRFGNNAVSIRNHKNAVSLRENAVSNKTITIDSNRIDNAAQAPKGEFSLKEYLKRMENDKRRHVNVIGHYFEEKGLKFNNEAEAQSAIRRHLRPAIEVAKFTDKDIVRATDQAKKEYGEKFTIETIWKVLTR